MADDILCAVKDLSVHFKGADGNMFEAVKHISFEIRKGQTLALVGESGSGKSVTALSLMQLLPYPNAFHPQGSIIFQGENVLGQKEENLHKIRGAKIAMIFQEPMTSLNPLHTIEKQITEVIHLHQKVTAEQAEARVIELLELVGLSKMTARLKAYPHELSGGQRQRVMIAMALANNPDLLIADEPTTALDVTVQAQILKLMREVQKKLGMAILLITHDLNVVRKMSDHVCVMRYGEIVEAGKTEDIFKAPQHDYTKLLLAAEPKGQAAPLDAQAETVMSAEAVKVYFPIKKGFLKRTVGNVKAVDGVSLEMKRGQTIGIVGESGSGKTTLAMALLRLNKAIGKIIFMGRDITGLQGKDLRALRRQLQVVFQDPYGALSPRLTVGDIVAEGLSVHEPQLSHAEKMQRVREIMMDVGLDPEMMGRYPHEFSGGQRQRISIARALILRPDIIMLDEPTSALDMSVQAQIVDLLRDLQTKYKLSYMFISHDLKVVRAMSHYVIVMKDGVVVEEGETEDIFNAPREPYTQKLLKAALEIDVI